jgi:hypothetical protein
MAYLACVVESEKKKRRDIKGYTCGERISWCVSKGVTQITTKKKRLRFLLKPCLELYL